MFRGSLSPRAAGRRVWWCDPTARSIPAPPKASCVTPPMHSLQNIQTQHHPQPLGSHRAQESLSVQGDDD